MTDNDKQIAPRRSGDLSIDFSTSDIDLSNLSAQARAEVEKYAATKKIDLIASVAEVKKDIQATSAGMNNVADVVRKMSASGDSVTIRQTIENSAGRVEIVSGNTEEAKRGKTSTSIDPTWLYVGGGIIAAVIVAAILRGG